MQPGSELVFYRKPGTKRKRLVTVPLTAPAKTAKPIEVKLISLDSIRPAYNQRQLQEDVVERIRNIIEVDGQLIPIVVKQIMPPKSKPDLQEYYQDGRPYGLLDGAHRIEAFRRLGRNEIFAQVVDDNAAA